MTKQSVELSTSALADSLTTWSRTQYWSTLRSGNLFPLVADICRRISFMSAKLKRYPVYHMIKIPNT